MANELLVNRVVKTNVSYPANTASTWIPIGIHIPTGAIVQGLTLMHTATPTIANAANTVLFAVGTGIPLQAGTAISDWNAAVTIPFKASFLTTNGMYISSGNEMYLKAGISNGTAGWTWNPDIYVEFMKP